MNTKWQPDLYRKRAQQTKRNIIKTILLFK